jgi:hypothetical protein
MIATQTMVYAAGFEWRPRRRSPGHCIVDVTTPERAEAIAARWPDAQHWGMEIRVLMHGGGGED